MTRVIKGKYGVATLRNTKGGATEEDGGIREFKRGTPKFVGAKEGEKSSFSSGRWTYKGAENWLFARITANILTRGK